MKLVTALKNTIRRVVDELFYRRAGNTRLLIACIRRDLKKAERILASRSPNVNVTNNFGVSPLMVACKNNWLSIVWNLILKGADVNIQSQEGFTALMVACDNEAVLCANVLIKRTPVDVHALDNTNKGALYIACRSGMVTVPHQLVERGVDVNAQSNENGGTALMWACAYDNMVTVRLIVERGHNVDVNIRAKNGKAALNIAKSHEIQCFLIRNVSPWSRVPQIWRGG